MEVTFNTQMLGTLIVSCFVIYMVYLWYKTNKEAFKKGEKPQNKYLNVAVFTVILGLVSVYVYSPVKVQTPKMSTIEYTEQYDDSIPERVVIEKETLDQAQEKFLKDIDKENKQNKQNK